MLILTLNSEAEYLQLISDAVSCGLHSPNPYSYPKDEDGMTLADSFVRFPEGEIYGMFGAYTSEYIPGTEIERNDEWVTYQSGCVGDQPVRLDYNHPDLLIPKEEDYPIVIFWNWWDSFDRYGDVSERCAIWRPLKEIMGTSPAILRDKRKTWDDRYKQKLQELFEK